MRKKILALACTSGVVLFGSLAFERLHPAAPVSATSFDTSLSMTPEVQRIIGSSCADCHSQGTRTPWYASIPPASWLLERDVRKARAAMNFSRWSKQNGKTPALAIGTLAAACAVVEAGQMPPAQYTLVHGDAAMTASDQKSFCAWTRQEIAHIASSRRVLQASAPSGATVSAAKSRKIRLLR